MCTFFSFLALFFFWNEKFVHIPGNITEQQQTQYLHIQEYITRYDKMRVDNSIIDYFFV